MAFCVRCGSELINGWQFCGNCGYPVSGVEVDRASVSDSRNRQTEIIDTGNESNPNRSQPTYIPSAGESSNRYTASSEKDLSGTTVDGKYILLSRMSSGGESELYACSDPDGQPCCIKLYHDFQHVRIEVRETLLTLNHENILGLIAWGYWNDIFYEVTPRIIGRSLEDMVKDDSIKNYDLKPLIKQMADAVHKLHSVGIIHQDIKPANFMVSENGNVKVIDFGISGLLEKSNNPEEPGRTHLTKIGETSDFASPQVVGNRTAYVGPSDDIFSLGATIYYMIFKRSCYVKTGNTGAIDWIRVTNNRIPDLDKLSEMFSPDEADHYQNLLYGLLQYEPEKRWKYEAVADWIKGDYAKWIVKKPKSANTTSVFSLDSEQFVIPDEIPRLVTTLAYKWRIPLLSLNGRFELLADTAKAIEVEDESSRGEKARIYTICNSTWTDMTNGSMRSYPFKGDVQPTNDGLYFIKLYQLYPDLRVFAWKHHVSKDLVDLGQNMLQVLWKEDIKEITETSPMGSGSSFFDSISASRQKREDSKAEPLTFTLLREIVDSHLISIYFYLHGQYGLSEQAFRIEKSVYNYVTIQEGYYELAYFLSGSSILDVHGTQYNGLPEFKGAVNDIISRCSSCNDNEPFLTFINLLCSGGTIKPGFKVWARHQGIEKYVDDLQTKLDEITKKYGG